MPKREEDTTAEDLKKNAENLEKESERENAENESRSDRVGSVDQEVAAAVSQQPSFGKSDQVNILHYITIIIKNNKNDQENTTCLTSDHHPT